ncbi:hypothetical protein SODALDRAFT_357656 [Sodiomyces alkalinus F11]|uniref:Uncharacterized protein n=1 Tax=Sodiomyces alkalinus (strain CBS 110278 / VKM F-3762 / F11) TaxID=1314773 RepID=A0A3N2Q4Q2_SODAK|nr:hypothetical protein SODALDRAFT_357656 [Sodiomyces alkalinus F11]ROT41595.1 hypothetical protein SODALDRAFT_357656 [Sodiomyces alkalinus F11]
MSWSGDDEMGEKFLFLSFNRAVMCVPMPMLMLMSVSMSMSMSMPIAHASPRYQSVPTQEILRHKPILIIILLNVVSYLVSKLIIIKLIDHASWSV